MGIGTNLSDDMRRIEQAGKDDWGYAVSRRIQIINL